MVILQVNTFFQQTTPQRGPVSTTTFQQTRPQQQQNLQQLLDECIAEREEFKKQHPFLYKVT